MEEAAENIITEFEAMNPDKCYIVDENNLLEFELYVAAKRYIENGMINLN